MFKKAGRFVAAALSATTQSEREELAKELLANGSCIIQVSGLGDGKVLVPKGVDVSYGKVRVPKEALTIEERERMEKVREYVPSVIEPSFGIGRIL